MPPQPNSLPSEQPRLRALSDLPHKSKTLCKHCGIDPEASPLWPQGHSLRGNSSYRQDLKDEYRGYVVFSRWKKRDKVKQKQRQAEKKAEKRRLRETEKAGRRIEKAERSKNKAEKKLLRAKTKADLEIKKAAQKADESFKKQKQKEEEKKEEEKKEADKRLEREKKLERELRKAENETANKPTAPSSSINTTPTTALDDRITQGPEA